MAGSVELDTTQHVRTVWSSCRRRELREGRAASSADQAARASEALGIHPVQQ